MRNWIQGSVLFLVLNGCSTQTVMSTYTAPVEFEGFTNRSPKILADGSEIVVLRVPAMI